MADVVQSIYWAVEHGADVINMSFSTPQYSRELEIAIRAAIDAKVICVASVSNSHSTTAVYPAALTDVVGVGATNDDDTAASFTDYGSAAEVGAPGVWIYSPYPNNAYAYSSGTSFAAPFVAGTAALLKSIDRNTTPGYATSYINAGTDPAKGFRPRVGRLNVLNTDRRASDR